MRAILFAAMTGLIFVFADGAAAGNEAAGSAVPRGDSTAVDSLGAGTGASGERAAAGEPDTLRRRTIADMRNEITPADTAAVDRFKPIWKSTMTASDTRLTLGSEMATNIEAGNGWNFTNIVKVEKRSYRGRDRQEISESFINTASKIEPDHYTLNMNLQEIYNKSKTIGLSRFGKDLITDSESAGASFNYSKPLLKARKSQIVVTGDGKRGRNDYKYDKAISGSVGGYLLYGVGKLLAISGGVATSMKREQSEIGSIQFDAAPSRMDTVRANLYFGEGMDKLLELKYSRTSGVDRMVAAQLSNSREIIDDPTLANQEESRKKRETITLTSTIQPFSFVTLDFEFNHRFDRLQNKIEKRLSKETENNELKASAAYKYAKSGNVMFNIEISEGDDDFGPFSTSSKITKSKTINMRLRQELGDSLTLNMSGQASLIQRFFKKRDVNPRDNDQLQYGANMDIKATPFPRFQADVSVSFNRRETINIDRTLSGDNRVDYLYKVGPRITLTPASWVRISQDYVIKMDYTEFVYNEDDNFLDRTTTLDTKADFQIMRPLSFGFRYRYLMRDSGSYLPRGDKRLYGRTNETFENGLFLDLRYQPEDDFAVKSKVEFRDQESNRLDNRGGKNVVTSSRLYESGSFLVGFERKRKISEDGSLDLDIAYVRNFGPFISKEKEEYWEVSAGLTFNF